MRARKDAALLRKKERAQSLAKSPTAESYSGKVKKQRQDSDVQHEPLLERYDGQEEVGRAHVQRPSRTEDQSEDVRV